MENLGVEFDGLVLFAGRNCPPCHSAMQWMNSNNVPYRPYPVDGDNTLIQWLATATGQRTVPQFFWNGAWVDGGIQAVKKMVAEGTIPT